MALLETRPRAGYTFLAVVIGHLVLISAQVTSKSGVPVLETITMGTLAEIQRGTAAALGGVRSTWSGYVALRGVQAENEALRNQIAQVQVDLQQQRALADRTRSLEAILNLRSSLEVETTAARIIGAAASPELRTVTIDKGSTHGIKVDMAVIAPGGVVGRVVVAGSRASRVQLIVDRNAAAGEETVAQIRTAGGSAGAFEADVSDEAQVEAAVARIGDRFGPATVLFNHAGTLVVKPFLETTVAEWDWLHAVNVRSMFLVTRAVLPGMIAAGGGSIVCTSSISAVAATPCEVLYDTTKGAVHMFARAIAVEFRDRGIRCNAVCPGFIRTPHGLREVADLQSLGVDVSEAAIAAQQGRIGEPEEVARAALFLASDEASFVNGAHLFVDNGKWYLLIFGDCQHLQPDNRCGTYDTRPKICRKYS